MVKRIRLGTMRSQVHSLALLSGLRIWHCRELWCRSQKWLGSMLLWLWRRLAATAPIRHLAWEPPYAIVVAKGQKAKKKKKYTLIDLKKPLLWYLTSNLFFFFFCLVFLRSYPWHMEVPRLWVKLELQLPAYPTATAMQEPSCVCDLHHSSRQCRILNPLSKTRDRTCVLLDTSWVC